MAVLIETNLGDLVVDLKVEQAPATCTNFLKLCKIKYYNNCLFHTVQKDHIALTGDPTNTGKGGACVYSKLSGMGTKHIKDEIHPLLKHNKRGTVAMANDAPNANGSQFYITLRDEIDYMDGKHTIFGVVGEGHDTLEKINIAMVDERNAPYQNIRIWHTEVLEDPFPDPEGLEALVPPKSPDVIQDEEFKRIEDVEEEAALQERLAKTLAKSQATTLELLHDLPDAEIEVPDNDLFIYKLNPVTQDGDLELIFSRFGPIKSCEIVRDWKTGDSLQYAFITFENARDCENAYFKMHDCVIDDRRIGVNFSQSVAKLWNKFRSGGAMSAADRSNAEGAKARGKGGGKAGGKGKASSKGGMKGKDSEDGKGKRPATQAAEAARDSRQSRRRSSRSRSRSRSRRTRSRR